AVFKPFLHDPADVVIRKFQYRTAAHIKCELFQLGEARAGQLVSEGPRSETEVASEALSETFEESRRLCAARRSQLRPNLEPSPCRPIQQLAVVRCANEDHVGWQSVDLEQQRRH